jgi:hypothetical protein
LLRCVDRWYREVVLFEDTWYDKIVVDHAWLVSYLNRLEGVLHNPDCVTFDADHPRGENFYGASVLQPQHGGSLLKICVRYRPADDERDFGIIVTAYPALKIKRRETIRWRK